MVRTAHLSINDGDYVSPENPLETLQGEKAALLQMVHALREQNQQLEIANDDLKLIVSMMSSQRTETHFAGPTGDVSGFGAELPQPLLTRLLARMNATMHSFPFF